MSVSPSTAFVAALVVLLFSVENSSFKVEVPSVISENVGVLCGTTDDLWGTIGGVLDLKWSEIAKFGCRRRKTWVLETVTADQVAEWAVDLPGTRNTF